MRVRLNEKDRIHLFSKLKEVGLKPKQIGESLNISPRTVTDWRRGKYTIPEEHFKKMLGFSQIQEKDLHISRLSEWWNNVDAAKKGAAARNDTHGLLGTVESRKAGGRSSYKKRKNVEGDIFSKTQISHPKPSKSLAELTGILIGDGGITSHQVSVYVNSVTDIQYGEYIAKLIQQLFGVQPSIRYRRNRNCMIIAVSSVRMVECLKSLGLSQGNKLKQGLDIPKWVLQKPAYIKACLRGIFDTDGCIFQETHRINNKKYSYPRIAIVSASPTLRKTIFKCFSSLGFKPKIRGNRSVNLEKLEDIKRYFTIVGTSNPKHLARFESFVEESDSGLFQLS